MTNAMYNFLVALNAMLVEQSDEGIRNGRRPFAVTVEPPREGILILTRYHDDAMFARNTGEIQREVGIEFKIIPDGDVVEGAAVDIEPLALEAGHDNSV